MLCIFQELTGLVAGNEYQIPIQNSGYVQIGASDSLKLPTHRGEDAL